MNEHTVEARLAKPEGRLTPHVVLLDDGLAAKLAALHALHLPAAEAVIAAGGTRSRLNGWAPEMLAWRQVIATLVAIAEVEGYQLDSGAAVS